MNLRRLLPLLCAALLLPAAARAATLNVPSQYPTIQAGVNAAVNGDTVLVADGTYSGPGNRDIDFNGNNITVTSLHGAASTIIDCGGFASTDGSGNHRGFYIHSGEMAAVINGFTVKNGFENGSGPSSFNSGSGGGVCVDGGTVTIKRCTVSGNTVQSGGGGIYSDHYNGPVHSGTITLAECTVSGNTARLGGGILCGNSDGQRDAAVIVTNCTVTGNTSSSGGGGISNGLNGGTVTLTACTVSGNIAQDYGGGISNENSGGGITLTRCTVSNNSVLNAGEHFYGGGGIYNYNSGGTVAITNCTIFANTVNAGDTANAGTGAGIYNLNSNVYSNARITITACTVAGNTGKIGDASFSCAGLANSNNGGPITLTNNIIYANNGFEVTEPSDPAFASAIAYCDIQGGYPGTGNINADPLFVNAAGGNFRLLSGSPCLGAGTSTGAPTADKDGRNRPNPPSIGAYELVPASVSHILWDNTTGTASVWTVAPDFTYTHAEYGPYPGWTATALAETPDGKTHLLWDHTADHQVSVWDVDAQNAFTFHNYGPFAGWAAAGMSAGPDGRLHLLWTHRPDGQMSLWSLDNGAGTYTHREYGPFAGWSANLVATGGDNSTDVVWANTSGQVSSWKVSAADGSYLHHEYGPYPGWTANALAAGPDGRASLAWANTNGTQSLWSADFGAGTFGFTNYGPYSGWAVTNAAVGADGVRRLLWNHASDGVASLWSVDGSGRYTYRNYGPFAGWSAVSLSAGQ